MIAGAFDATDTSLSIPVRVENAMQRVGVSITLTKVTSLVSFLLGATCAFPSVQWFCSAAGSWRPFSDGSWLFPFNPCFSKAITLGHIEKASVLFYFVGFVLVVFVPERRHVRFHVGLLYLAAAACQSEAFHFLVCGCPNLVKAPKGDHSGGCTWPLPLE